MIEFVNCKCQMSQYNYENDAHHNSCPLFLGKIDFVAIMEAGTECSALKVGKNLP